MTSVEDAIQAKKAELLGGLDEYGCGGTLGRRRSYLAHMSAHVLREEECAAAQQLLEERKRQALAQRASRKLLSQLQRRVSEDRELANVVRSLCHAVERSQSDMEQLEDDVRRLGRRLEEAAGKKGLRSSIGEIEYCTAQLDEYVMEVNVRWEDVQRHMQELDEMNEDTGCLERSVRRAYDSAIGECERIEILAAKMRETLRKAEAEEIERRQEAELEREKLKREQEERDAKLKELEQRRAQVRQQKEAEEKKRKHEEKSRQQDQPSPSSSTPLASTQGTYTNTESGGLFSSSTTAPSQLQHTDPKRKIAEDTSTYNQLSQALKNKQIVKDMASFNAINAVFPQLEATKASCDNGVSMLLQHLATIKADTAKVQYFTLYFSHLVLFKGQTGAVQQWMPFALAYVAVRIIEALPVLAEVLKGKFNSRLPLSVPMYVDAGQFSSAEDYKVAVGYQKRKGQMEEEGTYLIGVTGLIRTYGAIHVLASAMGVRCCFSADDAWTWLAMLGNQAPTPVTGRVLLAFLAAAGHDLRRHFGMQFTKLLKYFSADFCQRMPTGQREEVASVLKPFADAGDVPPLPGRELFP